MLKNYDPKTAKETILKRQPIDEVSITPGMQTGIREMFGEDLTPAQVVDRILTDIRKRGDEALLEWTEKLDGKAPEELRISKAEIEQALAELPAKEREALELSAARIHQFHENQPIHSWMSQDMGGTVGQFMRAIKRVGVYVPAGSAPLPSSVLMSAVPAQVAGVEEIVICAPPMRGTGKIAPIILAAAAMLGIDDIYPIGGAQAIGAMAYGTQTIKAVDKIFGPGNLFVSLAKRQVYGTVGIDSIAGPTETLVIADESANPVWVAADLLAQAEHDVLAAAVLISDSAEMIRKVQAEVEMQLQERSRKGIIETALEKRSGAILVDTLEEAAELSNLYAPEHLCLSVRDPWALSELIYAAGGIFMGDHSCEVLGDYVAGPSHVMPTGGSARYNSPLNLLDFIHVVSLVALNANTASKIAKAAETIALAEGLDAHAYAAKVRQ